jgi:outer membrane protein assembly factor BamB
MKLNPNCRTRRRSGLMICPPCAFWLLPVWLFCLGATALAQSPSWPQWGGPQRDFKSPAAGLAATWPATGPRRLWQRDLGEGYSAIAVEGGKLFTMCRKGEREVVIALDAATGKTVWEYAYDAPFWKEQDMSNGPGPHATPLVTEAYVFGAGVTGKLHCLNKQTGKLVFHRTNLDGRSLNLVWCRRP